MTYFCPICGNNATNKETISSVCNLDKYNCPNCGIIHTQPLSVGNDRLIEYSKQHLYSFLFYHHIEKEIVIGGLAWYKVTSVYLDDYYYISPEDVENWYPKTLAEKIDLSLLFFSSHELYWGQEVEYSFKQLCYILFVDVLKYLDNKDSDESVIKTLEYIVDYYNELGYAKVLSYNSTYDEDVWNECIYAVKILPNGIKHIEELQRAQVQTSYRVFVAMKFGTETKLLREAIRLGIVAAGFEAVFMDEIEHNHQIVPEMLYQIRNSRFVVAELSHHNNGAYYEAGYALGLGKEVIHICNNDSIKNGLHFDVAQINTITYDNLAELPEKLSKRIKATIG